MNHELGTEAPVSRRRLLGGGAALAATGAFASFLPRSLRRMVLESTHAPQEFDLSQVKHVVLLMQENRSFDHYFGTLSGVRGFKDRSAVTLPDGHSVFQQPDRNNPDGYLLPYHLDSLTSYAQGIPSLNHSWQVEHECSDSGRMDSWLKVHLDADGRSTGPYTMGYYKSTDIPFHFSLANAFTICDNYFCSVLGPTDPNRLMWSTGTIDPQGSKGGPALDNDAPRGTYHWTTYAERLEGAGVTWKCYQQADNRLNPLTQFEQFIDTRNPSLAKAALAVSTRFDGRPASDPAMAFEEDCASGTLPTVS